MRSKKLTKIITLDHELHGKELVLGAMRDVCSDVHVNSQPSVNHQPDMINLMCFTEAAQHPHLADM